MDNYFLVDYNVIFNTVEQHKINNHHKFVILKNIHLYLTQI